MKLQAIRHGDLALLIIPKLPKMLTAAPGTSHTLKTGVHGNNHDIQGATYYPKREGQYVSGYVVAGPNCTMSHPDHGHVTGATRTNSLPAGIYELHDQFEHKHESMVQVID